MLKTTLACFHYELVHLHRHVLIDVEVDSWHDFLNLLDTFDYHLHLYNLVFLQFLPLGQL